MWEHVGTNIAAADSFAARDAALTELADPEQQTRLAKARDDAATLGVAAASALLPPEPPQMPAHGEPAGRLIIPAIGVDVAVAVGTDDHTLRGGPGVWTPGVFPGAPGNATISGHRTTYGAPFRHIDSLTPGDLITFSTPGRPDAVFEVRETQVVAPEDVSVTYQTDGVRLTLTTCDPVGSAADRLVLQAEMVSGEFHRYAVPRDNWTFQR